MNQPAGIQPKVSLAQSSPTLGTFRERDGALEWSGRQETVRVEPWGPDAVRVRARLGGAILDGLPGALLDEPPAGRRARSKIGDAEGQLTVGALTVHVDAEGRIRFLRSEDGRRAARGGTRPLLVAGLPAATPPPAAATTAWSSASRPTTASGCSASASTSTAGSTRRAWCWTWCSATPRSPSRSLSSSRGYGLLWNNPAIGRVELAANGTRWVADAPARSTTGSPPARPGRDHAPLRRRRPAARRCCREWAAGFWQSQAALPHAGRAARGGTRVQARAGCRSP